MSDPIRLLVVDDHMIMRVGIVHALRSAADIVVVGEAETGEEALYLCRKLHPHVVLMDVDMAGMGGRAVTRAIHEHYPDIAIVALTMHEDPVTVRDMMAAGASGYLSKTVSSTYLISAIRRILDGETVMGLARPDMQVAPEAQRAGTLGLAPQQRRVLALVIKGCTNAEIASCLGISERTARHHVSAILAKLGAANRAEAVAVALRDGLAGGEE